MGPRAVAAMRNEAGVTLIEVFVVVSILALVSLTVLPFVGTYLQDTKAKGAAEQAAGALRQARGTVTEPYTGHAELWYDRRGVGNNVPERAFGMPLMRASSHPNAMIQVR